MARLDDADLLAFKSSFSLVGTARVIAELYSALKVAGIMS
jgi:hypothetical protein